MQRVVEGNAAGLVVCKTSGGQRYFKKDNIHSYINDIQNSRYVILTYYN